MATRPRPRVRRGVIGWILAIGGLVLLAAGGFGLGVLAGGFWEEPELVLSYLFGETEAVSGFGVARPDPAPREERGVPKGTPDPLPRVAAAPPPTPGQMAVQVGAFAESVSAEGLATSLRERGYPVYVSPGAKAGESRWRVRVGPLASRDQADQTANRLRREEKLPTWVLNEGN